MKILVIQDFDGASIASYDLIKKTFEYHGMDIGDKKSFSKRRKFAKYFGGGRELGSNIRRKLTVKLRTIRETLTDLFIDEGEVFPEVVSMLNSLNYNQNVKVGILSRSYLLEPQITIGKVLKKSGVENIDFIECIGIAGRKKTGFQKLASGYKNVITTGDEIGDYRASRIIDSEHLACGYGFDSIARLIKKGNVPKEIIVRTPSDLETRVLLSVSQIN